MKEATGELSTTVIAIVAIAAILAIFTAFLLPMLRAQIALTQACNGGPGYTAKEEGYEVQCSDVNGALSGTFDNTKKCNGDNNAQVYTCGYKKTDK